MSSELIYKALEKALYDEMEERDASVILEEAKIDVASPNASTFHITLYLPFYTSVSTPIYALSVTLDREVASYVRNALFIEQGIMKEM